MRVVLTPSPRYRGGSPGTVAFVVIVNMGSSYCVHQVSASVSAMPTPCATAPTVLPPQRSQTSVFEV